MDGERDILDQSGGRRRSKILARLFWFHFLTSRFRNIPLRRCWWWAFVCRIPRDSSLSPASSSRARAGCLLPYILRIRVWTRGVPLGVIFIIHRAIWTGWTCGLSAYIPGRPTYNMYKSGAPHHFSFCFFFSPAVNQIGTHTKTSLFSFRSCSWNFLLAPPWTVAVGSTDDQVPKITLTIFPTLVRNIIAFPAQSGTAIFPANPSVNFF